MWHWRPADECVQISMWIRTTEAKEKKNYEIKRREKDCEHSPDFAGECSCSGVGIKQLPQPALPPLFGGATELKGCSGSCFAKKFYFHFYGIHNQMVALGTLMSLFHMFAPKPATPLKLSLRAAAIQIKYSRAKNKYFKLKLIKRARNLNGQADTFCFLVAVLILIGSFTCSLLWVGRVKLNWASSLSDGTYLHTYGCCNLVYSSL